MECMQVTKGTAMMNIMHWIHAQIMNRKEGEVILGACRRDPDEKHVRVSESILGIPQPYSISECEETMRLLCKLVPFKHIDIVPEKFYRLNIYHDGQKFATVYAGTKILYNNEADYEAIEKQSSRGFCECIDIFTHKKVVVHTVHDLINRIIDLYKYIRIYEKYAIHMDDEVLSPFEHPEFMIAQLFDIICELDKKLEQQTTGQPPTNPLRNRHLYSKL